MIEQSTDTDVTTSMPCAHDRSRIVVFAREPVLGQVKSRLASEIGQREALSLYRSMLARVGCLLGQRNIAKWALWVTSNTSHKDFLSICNKRDISIQEGEGLGRRMDAAIQQTLRAECVDNVILIGTDCPAITSSYLDQALHALESGVDVVLGPAEDGGYVLIGMSRPLPALFDDIPWGTSQVMARTLEAVKAMQLSCTMLDTLWDVDRPQDLQRLGQLEPPLNRV